MLTEPAENDSSIVISNPVIPILVNTISGKNYRFAEVNKVLQLKQFLEPQEGPSGNQVLNFSQII